MRKLPTRKLLGALIAGALFLPNKGFTLGLGEIEVNSALNQKLNADIEILSATPEDTETIIVKLASRKEFQRAGLDRPYELSDLRFKPVIIDDVPHIIVTSSGPIREPFLNFLVEVDWPNGHLLREYTVLLDPPVFMTQSASTAAAPVNQAAATSDTGFRPGASAAGNVVPVYAPSVSASSSSARPAQSPSEAVSQAPVSPAFIPAPMVQQQTSINQPPGSYRIQSGDTAWSLADAMRPDKSISVEQMMIAMLRANPESFINENINGLKRGYILRLPDYDQIATVNQADARALVREQAALWRQYQQSQAGGQPVSAIPADAVSDAGGAGESESSTSADAYLEIVSAGSGTSTMSGKDPTKMSAQELRAELAIARERVETERVEKEALQQRIGTLEQQVNKMKGMLSIEDEELSGVQSLGALSQDELTALQSEQEVLVGETAQEQGTAESPDAESADMAAEEAVAEMPADVAGSTEEDVVFTDQGAAEESAANLIDESGETAESGEPVVDETNVAAETPMTQKPSPDLLSRLLNDPMLLAAAGGGLLLIAALIGLIIKRRKAAAETSASVMDSGIEDLESLADDIAETESRAEEVVAESLAEDQSAAAETSKNDFESDATMVQDSAEDTVITEASTSTADQGEVPRDDVIAEADVYLAYGIYQQAEELLLQAIADNPDRDDYRVKLAETYYASKNAEAFVEVASEIKQRAASDDAPAWKKVMVMGQDLCADNPMFQGSMVGGLDVGSLAPAAPEMDFDLGIDEDVDNEALADLDLSQGDEALELPEMEGGLDEVMAEEEAAVEEIDELEFDLSDTGAVEESAAAEDEFSLDIDASELDIDIKEETADSDEESIDLGDIDLGLDEEAEVADDEVMDVGDLDFGLEDTTPEAETDTETAAFEEAEEEISLDLSDEESLDIDSLDMGVEEELEAAAATEAEEPAADTAEAFGELTDEDDFDLSSLDDVDEVSTKLDLARAYLDMGDHEGSRGILEEVLVEGNDEQKEEANELMAKLD